MAYELIQSVRMNQSYIGHAERCTWEFTVPLPEQLAQWPADLMIQAHVNQLATQNSQLLELHVWRDIAPDFSTNYRVVTIATASPLFWNLIILGVLAAIIAIAVAWSIKEIKDLPTYVSIIWGVAAITGAVALILIVRQGGQRT